MQVSYFDVRCQKNPQTLYNTELAVARLIFPYKVMEYREPRRCVMSRNEWNEELGF